MKAYIIETITAWFKSTYLSLMLSLILLINEIIFLLAEMSAEFVLTKIVG
jgi:hypothetical protein